MNRLHRADVTLALVLVGVAAIALGAQQRDVPAPAITGTARVAGVVSTTDDTPQPVRRAIVSLTDAAQQFDRHAVTDDDGRFEFTGLPGGRFSLVAARPSFVSIAYGATRPGRPGASVAVEPGEQIADVRVRMARGAAITGTVRDAAGDTIASLDVVVRRVGGVAGAASGPTSVKTDDQGVFRFFGLPAGRYLVSTSPLLSDAVNAPSDSDVDAALRELRQPRAAAPRSGVSPGTIPTASTPVRPEPTSRPSRVVPIYYPSALAQEDAVPIVVGAGEERDGVDITVRLLSASAIAGRVVATGTQPTSTVLVSLTRATSRGGADPIRSQTQADGTFRFESVVPGRYLVAATAYTPAVRASEPGGRCEFASEEVSVAGGGDVLGLSLMLRPCLTIEGRIEFTGTTLKPPSNLESARVTLQPDTSPGTTTPIPIRWMLPVMTADGRFVLGELGDVLPGAYHLRVDLPGSEPGRGWWLQSVTADGRDILDAPLELTGRSPATTTATLTFTDQHSSLSGVLEAPPRQAAVDYTVIAFTTNRDWWRAPFRRVRTARPATNGQYLFQDLPPGEYYLAALTDLAPDDWRDPEFLAQIVDAAIRVTIGPGEQKIQGLRIGRGAPLSHPSK